jgi:putative ABC transport system permease protein
MTFPDQTPRWRRYLHFWRKDIRADVDDELAFHFQTRISALTEAGHTSEDAHAIALREFGDVRAVRTDLVAIDDRIERRAQRTEWLDGWRQDLIYSARSLRRTPGVTAAIIATLALGLGANAAMFTLLNAVFLKPPSGVARPHEVRRVWTELQFTSGSQFWPGYDYSEYDRIRRAADGVGTTTMYSYPEPAKVRRGSRVSTARSTRAPANYFPELGVRPAIGRFYTPDEDRLGAGQHVVVLSHAYWRRAFDADSAIIGEAIHIGGIPYTIIGVADRAFNGADLTATDMWVPLATTTGYGDQPWWTDRNVNGFQVLVRVAALASSVRRSRSRLGSAALRSWCSSSRARTS